MFDATLQAVSRKISVARMLNVRNSIMEAGVSPVKIIPELVPAKPFEGSQHWVVIEVIEE